jgi:hypothetical protein
MPDLPSAATPDSHRLFDLARRVLGAFAELPGVACAAVCGSTAEGCADELSDLDSTVYYDSDSLPPFEAIDAVRVRLGGGDLAWKHGEPADGGFAFAFPLDGVEVQVGHTTFAQWEREIDEVLAGRDPASPLHKAMYGTLTSIAISGDEHLQRWKRRVGEYSEPLRRAMVEHHLKFFPIWRHARRLARRDAGLWFRQAIVDNSFNVLGALAGLNRRYFTSFQFKRMRAFESSLAIRPDNLVHRLEGLWETNASAAAAKLRDIVGETAELIAREMPEVDLTGVRKSLI